MKKVTSALRKTGFRRVAAKRQGESVKGVGMADADRVQVAHVV